METEIKTEVTGKVKFLIVTAFWKRPHISEIYWLGIERLREHFNIETLAIVSDPENKALAEQHSDHVLETPNEPFGQKMNTAFAHAITLEFDVLMQLGSDNLISNMAMMKHIDSVCRGILFFGLNRALFYDSETGKARQKFYGHTFGAGRCIARPILIKALRKGNLWEADRMRGMDNTAEHVIEAYTGLLPVPIEFDTPQLIDIKSAENIWSFDFFKDEPECSADIMKDLVGKQEWKAIKDLIPSRKVLKPSSPALLPKQEKGVTAPSQT